MAANKRGPSIGRGFIGDAMRRCPALADTCAWGRATLSI